MSTPPPLAAGCPDRAGPTAPAVRLPRARLVLASRDGDPQSRPQARRAGTEARHAGRGLRATGRGRGQGRGVRAVVQPVYSCATHCYALADALLCTRRRAAMHSQTRHSHTSACVLVCDSVRDSMCSSIYYSSVARVHRCSPMLAQAAVRQARVRRPVHAQSGAAAGQQVSRWRPWPRSTQRHIAPWPRSTQLHQLV